MAKRKRYAPSIDEIVPQRGVSGAVPGYGVGGQSAGYDERAGGMQQLAHALGNLNPALRSWGKGRERAGQVESLEYHDEMMAGVTKNAAAFSKLLKEAGHSQANNPHVYRNQIINIAESSAKRDVNDLLDNEEFVGKLELLSKKSEDFRSDALELFKQYPTDTREIEKGAGGFWDMGYGKGYIEQREKLLESYKAQNGMYKRRKIIESFHENGRSKLTSFMSTKPRIDGKTNKEYEKAFTEFRNYVSDQYNAYPEEGIGYTQSVFDFIVLPMFQQMANDPDNDVNLKQAWDRIMGMSRNTLDKDGNVNGRINLFSKYGDISKEKGVQVMADMWGKVAVTEESAAKVQTQRGVARQVQLQGAVKPVLKYWDSWSTEHAGFLKEQNIDPSIDPYDKDNWEVIGRALAEHPDFSFTATDSQAETNRMFLEAFSTMRSEIDNNTAMAVKRGEDARAALIRSAAASIEASPMIMKVVDKELRQAIGDPNLSAAEVQGKLMDLVNPDELAIKYFLANPHVSPKQLPFIDAYGKWASEYISQKSLSYGRIVASAANMILSNPKASVRDMEEMIKRVRDVAVEIDDTKLDGELNSLQTELEERTKIAPYFKVSNEEWDDMVEIGLTFGDTPDEVVEILANAKKLSATTGQGFKSGTTGIDNHEWAAARQAKGIIREQARQIYGEEILKQLEIAGNTENKENYMTQTGKGLARADTQKRIATLKRALVNEYKGGLESSAEGQKHLTKEREAQMDDDDVESLRELRTIENSFAVDGEFGGAMKTPGELAGEPALSLQWTTGRAGQQRWEALKNNRIQRENNRLLLDASAIKKKLEWEQAKTDGSSTPADIANKRTNYEEAVRKVKNHIFAFEGVHFVDLMNPKGHEIPFRSLEGRTSGNTIPVNINTDNINPLTMVIYESPAEMKALGTMLNDLETRAGRAQNVRAVDVELTQEDVDSAPPELKLQAEFIRRTLGADILAKHPAERLLAHQKLDQVNSANIRSMYVRMPEKMPVAVREGRKLQALEQYANTEFPTYQGIEFSDEEKAWVKSNLDLRKEMLDADVNTTDGITGDRVIDFYHKAIGGEQNASDALYMVNEGSDVWGGFDKDGQEIRAWHPDVKHTDAFDPGPQAFPFHMLKAYWKRVKEAAGFDAHTGLGYSLIRERPEKHWSELEGGFLSEKDWGGARAFPQPKQKPKDVLAMEFAMMDIGISNPTTTSHRYNSRESVHSWGFQMMPIPYGKHKFPGMAFDDKIELTLEKVATLKVRTHHYRTLLNSGVEEPELAKAYNKWLKSESNFFQGRYNKENVFDLRPLPIPEKNPTDGKFAPKWGESFEIKN